MKNKIAVVCLNPWEKFLPAMSQGNARAFYEWLYQQAILRNENPYYKEQVEQYGDLLCCENNTMFLENIDAPQFLYIQSKQQKLLEEVLTAADSVVVGMPGCKKECDRIYLSVLPWKEKSFFLWDSRIGMGDSFFKKIQSEYKLKDKQIMKFKMLPSF